MTGRSRHRPDGSRGGSSIGPHDDKLSVRGFGDEVRRCPRVPLRHVGLGRYAQAELAGLVHYGEPFFFATPAVADGVMYLRTSSHLFSSPSTPTTNRSSSWAI
jgi:hypothetical protein